MGDIYSYNHDEVLRAIKTDAGRLGLAVSFSQLDKRQLPVILDQAEGAMTKVVYERFKRPDGLQQRLQDKLFEATLLGESHSQVTRRIEGVIRGGYKQGVLDFTGDPLRKACKTVAEYEYACAKRIVRTERTRVQSQARYQAGGEAVEKGVRLYYEWSTKTDGRERDTHAELDGQKRLYGEPFILSDGDVLRFPGDPNGRAENVINCRCVLIPHVLLSTE